MCKFYVGTLNWSVYDVLSSLSDIFSEYKKICTKNEKKKKTDMSKVYSILPIQQHRKNNQSILQLTIHVYY